MQGHWNPRCRSIGPSLSKDMMLSLRNAPWLSCCGVHSRGRDLTDLGIVAVDIQSGRLVIKDGFREVVDTGARFNVAKSRDISWVSQMVSRHYPELAAYFDWDFVPRGTEVRDGGCAARGSGENEEKNGGQ